MNRRLCGYSVVPLLLVLAMLLPSEPAFSQIQDGATLSVLRGQVAVVRPDGSAVQPAPSGTVVRAGDEIRTLTETGALITFFVGTEIELGAETILAVEQVTRQGERVDVSLRQVLGVSLNRVQTFSDPGSAYRIDAGGAVAVVRGTTFLLLGPTADGIVVIVCLEDCDGRTTFAGVPLVPFIGYYAEVERGRVVGRPVAFRPNREAGYWNAASEAVTTALQDLQGDTRDRPAGQVPRGQRQEIRAQLEREEREADEDDKKKTTPTTTPTTTTLTTAPTPTSTTTTTTPGAAACGTITTSGGAGVTETKHELGKTGGTFNFTYNAFSVPDQFDILYEGKTIFTTGGPVSGSNSVRQSYGPGTETTVTVRVTGPTGTAWTYTLGCPE